MELSNFGLPRKVKECKIREYLGGIKTARMPGEESGMSLNAINKMTGHYKDRFLPAFEYKPVIPAMKERTETVGESDLMHEVSELRRQLNAARLKIEGYERTGDILEERYGIDLLKKSEARRSPDSGSDTRKQTCVLSAVCPAIRGKRIINRRNRM